MSKDGNAGFLTTKLDTIVNWSRKNSMWPFPFGTSCCGIEMMATLCSDYDMARFGAEVVRFSPRQSDMLIVAGIITQKMAPVLTTVYEQMSEPKWVMSFGACASSGGIFDVYSVVQGIDTIIPVDIYIPGCPPSPEMVLFALTELQQLVQSGATRSQIREKGLRLGRPPAELSGGPKSSLLADK
jgi:NADH-quinone oxidoreductase subunit B